jgi:hypothetical protein
MRNFYPGKSSSKIWATSVHNYQKNIPKVNNPTHNEQKFAQSGHPAMQPRRLLRNHFALAGRSFRPSGWVARCYACFLTKNPKLGKFLRAKKRGMFDHDPAIWNILQPSGIVCGPLVYFYPVLVCCT